MLEEDDLTLIQKMQVTPPDNRAMVAAYLERCNNGTDQPTECYGCHKDSGHHPGCVLEDLIDGWELAVDREGMMEEIKQRVNDLFSLRYDHCMTDEQFRDMISYCYKQRRIEP